MREAPTSATQFALTQFALTHDVARGQLRESLSQLNWESSVATLERGSHNCSTRAVVREAATTVVRECVVRDSLTTGTLATWVLSISNESDVSAWYIVWCATSMSATSMRATLYVAQRHKTSKDMSPHRYPSQRGT